jgi:hypothetical membrane protein
LHYLAAVIVFLVLGIAIIATSCSIATPSRDRVLYLAIGLMLVLLAIGIAGIELIKGGST